MKYAWQILRSTSKTWKECLKQAWRVVKLLSLLASNPSVQFRYYKTNGSMREANGTLLNIPYAYKGKGKENWATVRYYDVAKMAFRSFKIENLLAF